MKLLVNGVLRETDAADIARALVELGYGDSVVATALNGEFVPSDSRHLTPLCEADQLEILAPMQGG